MNTDTTVKPRVYRFTFPDGEVIRVFAQDKDAAIALAMNEAKWRKLKFTGVVIS